MDAVSEGERGERKGDHNGFPGLFAGGVAAAAVFGDKL